MFLQRGFAILIEYLYQDFQRDDQSRFSALVVWATPANPPRLSSVNGQRLISNRRIFFIRTRRTLPQESNSDAI